MSQLPQRCPRGFYGGRDLEGWILMMGGAKDSPWAWRPGWLLGFWKQAYRREEVGDLWSGPKHVSKACCSPGSIVGCQFQLPNVLLLRVSVVSFPVSVLFHRSWTEDHPPTHTPLGNVEAKRISRRPTKNKTDEILCRSLLCKWKVHYTHVRIIINIPDNNSSNQSLELVLRSVAVRGWHIISDGKTLPKVHLHAESQPTFFSPFTGTASLRITHIIQPSVKWFWRYSGSLEIGCRAEAGSVRYWLQAARRGEIDMSSKHQGLDSFGNEKGFVKAWWFINNSLNWREHRAYQLTSI